MFKVYNRYSNETYDVELVVSEYPKPKNLYLSLFSPEGPYATITVNLCYRLPKFYGCVDVNNFPEAIEFIKENDLGVHVPSGIVSSGYCSYPIYLFNMPKIVEVCGIEEIDLTDWNQDKYDTYKQWEEDEDEDFDEE